jgi:hypothetical protein
VTAATQARLASGDAARADRLHLSPALRAEPPLTASQLDDADMDNIFAEDGIGPDPVPEYALPGGQANETLKRRVVQHAARKAGAVPPCHGRCAAVAAACRPRRRPTSSRR